MTTKDLEHCTVIEISHGNMGYVQNEDGSYTGRHKGYSYGYRCVQYPRMSFEDRHHTLDDAGWERVYYVDGETCKYEDIPALLSKPAQLTLAEFYVLERIGDRADRYYELISYAAGCVQPEPNYIDGNTRWGKVYHIFENLRDKGLIDMKRGRAQRKQQ